MTNMKRISTDLHRLGECCKKHGRYFAREHSELFNAITEEPFGADKIDILRHDHARVRRIQDAEKILVEQLAALEDELG